MQKQISNIFGAKVKSIHWGSYDGQVCQWLVVAGTDHHICLPWEHPQYGDFLVGDTLAYTAVWNTDEHIEEIYTLGQGEVMNTEETVAVIFEDVKKQQPYNETVVL